MNSQTLIRSLTRFESNWFPDEGAVRSQVRRHHDVHSWHDDPSSPVLAESVDRRSLSLRQYPLQDTTFADFQSAIHTAELYMQVNRALYNKAGTSHYEERY